MLREKVMVARASGWLHARLDGSARVIAPAAHQTYNRKFLRCIPDSPSAFLCVTEQVHVVPLWPVLP